MRTISEIVVHHSYSPRDQELEKSIKSFNDTHYRRLYLPHKQPLSGVEGSEYVAYHFVIAGDGSHKRTRLDEKVGYHASNIEANNRSVGICLTGNFDVELPTTAQLKKLQALVNEYQKEYDIQRITGHRTYANKSCPGLLFTDEMIARLSGEVEPPVSDEAREAVEWAKQNGITNGERMNDPATRLETVLMLYRTYHLPK